MSTILAIAGCGTDGGVIGVDEPDVPGGEDDGDGSGGDGPGEGEGEGEGGGDGEGGGFPDLPPLTVCASGAEYTTLQEAIDAAEPGQSIEVCAGTYRENLVIQSSVALVGVAGSGETSIDAGGGGTGVDVNGAPAPGVMLRGFTILNGAADRGGGIHCDTSTLALEDVTITSSSAGAGGGMAAASCELAVTASRFTGNTATGRGGGLHLESSTGQLSESVIDGNQANLGGGVFQFEGGVAILDSEIRDNVAQDIGAGIWQESDGRIAGNLIADNRSVERGAGITVIEHAPVITQNTVKRNESGDDGAGIYLYLSRATVSDNVISGNESGGDAGGLRVLGSQAIIVGNQVRDNVAVGDGGGMKISHNESVVSDNVFDGNTAHGYGGGVELDDDWSTLSRLVITNNRAYRGGGLHCHEIGASFRVEHTLIAHNTATRSGGAVRFSEVWATGTFAFVTMANNSAPEVGGADFADAEEELDPMKPIRRVEVENSIIANNEGIEVRNEGGIIRGWSHTDVSPAEFAGMADPAGSDGNISQPPGFVAPGESDYHLRADSPCRNAGDPALKDPDGTRADMGAHGGPDAL